MRSFGASAPLKDLQREFGFTVERVVDAAKAQLGQVKIDGQSRGDISMKIALAADHGGFDMKDAADREAPRRDTR